MSELDNLYVLDDRKRPQKAKSLKEWSACLNSDRSVAQDAVGDVRVCTSFVCYDYRRCALEPPLTFESMIFGGPYDSYFLRYCSWEAAEAGHEIVVKKLLEGQHPTDWMAECS